MVRFDVVLLVAVLDAAALDVDEARFAVVFFVGVFAALLGISAVIPKGIAQTARDSVYYESAQFGL